MFWYLFLAVSVIILVVSIIFIRKTEDLSNLNIFFMYLCGISIACILFLLLYIPIQTYSNKMDIDNFQRQKEYIESNDSEYDIQNAAMTQKKTDLNEWLYNAQFSYCEYNFFTLLPDEIMDLHEIN